jgi:ParB family chromosome partitioning protein
MTLRLDDIVIPASARPCSAAAVADLARSIGELGLQSAPTIVEREGRYVLVAGRHRIEALRQLGVKSVLVRLVDFDDIEARLWTISENLHRAELTVAQRAAQLAEYAELTQRTRAAAQTGVLRQVGAKVGRPESGNRAAARELGLTEQEVRRARAIAGLSEAAMAAATEEGLDDNQAALLQASQEPTAEAQIEALGLIGKRARAADEPDRPGPAAKPLRNLENMSGGELARWIKLTTPNDRPHVVRVLEMAAAILRDELAAQEAQNCAVGGLSEGTGAPGPSGGKNPPAAAVGPAKGRIRI